VNPDAEFKVEIIDDRNAGRADLGVEKITLLCLDLPTELPVRKR
jgi:hypothetical protein